MKVIQVLNHFLPQQTAGTEVYTWALSKQLQQKGIEVEIVIPHYGEQASASYEYDGLKVFQYAEPSVVDRSLMMGFKKPDGLKAFAQHVKNEKPDIVHFHELAGSNGIGLQHIIAAKQSGAKVIMTFHLAGNTCKTGNLLYMETDFCDGKINIDTCSRCYLHGKSNGIARQILPAVAALVYKTGIDTTTWGNPLGTALGTGFIINKLKKDFEELVKHCDKVVVLTAWYKKILLLNGVAENMISYVPQGLPVEVLKTTAVENEKTAGTVKLIFVGRISSHKGLHLLVDALCSLPTDKIELDIYGQSVDTDYETGLRNKTAAYNNINWKGMLAPEAVVNTMQQYDALCLCSTFSEMSPLVIQEAFAAGIPVIASNVYGNAEQVTHDKNGLLFKFKEPASLRQQLQRCVDDNSLLKQMKKNILPPHSFKEVGEAYCTIYEEMLTGR